MSFTLSIAQAIGDPLTIELVEGGFLFVLGPNGAGKSSLMQNLGGQHRLKSRRISAHRQTWLDSGQVNVTPQQGKNMRENFDNLDAAPTSRWRDDNPAQRVQLAIYDLIASQNERARRIAVAVDAKDIPEAQRVSSESAPLNVINDLLGASNLPIEISIGAEDQILARKNGGEPYSIAELSDGERNALLIAANVLTAPPGTLILVDEPERHLHRSIISPLLAALFDQRRDCAFVVSTHDISLCTEHGEAKILLVRDCTMAARGPVSWEVDLVPATKIDDSLKRDILGSRRTILYVEGISTSLDQPLYSLLFPGVSIVAKENCREVERAVDGLRGSEDIHWIRAFGLVDGDGRNSKDILQQRGRGIFAVDAYSVESIYYHDLVLENLAQRHSQLVGGDPKEKLGEARSAALSALIGHGPRLAQRVAEKSIRSLVMELFPTQEQVTSGAKVNLEIDCGAILKEEQERFETHLSAADLSSLVRRYPLRESPALDQLAKKLGFTGREQYEAAVQKALASDDALASSVRALFPELVAALTEPQVIAAAHVATPSQSG